jgi:hypothetical protein
MGVRGRGDVKQLARDRLSHLRNQKLLAGADLLCLEAPSGGY